MAIPFKPKESLVEKALENNKGGEEDLRKAGIIGDKYSKIKEDINDVIVNIMHSDGKAIPDTFEYGKLREGRVMKHLIKALKQELGIDRIREENIEIHQLVEKEIDENFDFKGLRILFKNDTGKEIVKNISVTIEKESGDIKDLHMSLPSRLVNKTVEELQTRNLNDIEVSENTNSKRGIELDNKLDTPKEIAVEMIKNHWGKFLLKGEDAVIQAFEEKAILKGTLDNTYSIGKDLKDYFVHFCHMNPELNLIEDSVKADWLTPGKTIKASGNYIFNVGEEGNKTPVEGNFTFILKKVGENNKWAFSVLHSSIKNNAEELKMIASKKINS